MSARTIDFLAVGPQRTGSTWLYETLLNHPQIAWPNGVKETFFFDVRFAKGFEWYYWHFQKVDSKPFWGEVAPTYFDHRDAAKRVLDHAPECKIVINVRNPIEKTYSVFRHYYTSGLVPIDFDLAIQKMPRIVDCGHYQRYGEMWEELFGKSQVFYLVQDDIRANPQGSLDQVCEFIGLDPFEVAAGSDQAVNMAAAPRSPGLVWLLEAVAKTLRGLHLHSVVNFGKTLGLKRLYHGGAEPSPLSASQHQQLIQEFESDIEWLERKLDRSFAHWTKPPITR